MSDQTDQFEEVKRFVLTADMRSLLHQLNADIKTPLISAQNLANMLLMMQSPSPAVQKKMDHGELDAEQMLSQITQLITHVFDLIDSYRAALEETQR